MAATEPALDCPPHGVARCDCHASSERHVFGPALLCEGCGVSWRDHQAAPAPCPTPHVSSGRRRDRSEEPDSPPEGGVSEGNPGFEGPLPRPGKV